MWSELTQLVEKRCRKPEGRGPRQARALLALCGGLSQCELAFERLHAAGPRRSEADTLDCVLAMDSLFAVLHNIQPALQLFETEPAIALARYARAPGHGAVADNPTGRLREQVELLRWLLAIEESEDGLDVPTLTAFMGARRELGRFAMEVYDPARLLTD